MKCPHCQNQIEVPDLWEFFDCINCGASLQVENNELKILKDPDESTSTNHDLQQKESSPKEGLIFGETQDNSINSSALEETSEAASEDIPQSEQTAQDESPEQSENLSNILDFGGSSDHKNHFTYCLHIKGISSQALFEKIRYILKSPRVSLDCPAFNNTLVIDNLNAVQMFYLVRKLSPLSAQIHWTQKSTLME